MRIAHEFFMFRLLQNLSADMRVAIASGCIDFILSPQDIAAEILHIARLQA